VGRGGGAQGSGESAGGVRGGCFFEGRQRHGLAATGEVGASLGEDAVEVQQKVSPGKV
jgi:hypothetical protein